MTKKPHGDVESVRLRTISLRSFRWCRKHSARLDLTHLWASRSYENDYQISMQSWPTYQQYSGNLGIQTLTDITGNHFGPSPASQDYNGWGQWTRAGHKSIGMERTAANWTSLSGTYPPEIIAMYENIDTTPNNFFLWFHHVNYTHAFHSGEEIIQ